MKKFCVNIILLLSAFVYPAVSRAQITVVPGVAAAVMANKLAGPGVVVINPVLTCASNAYGTFSGPSTLSFDSGIVLTSGQAQTSGFTYGANGPAINFASTSNGTAGDPLLDGLAGGTTNDACILEFDFRPIGDTVRFEYVFGSEEYTDFTCSEFNDVFGFFISGPGYGSPTNLAIVPGTAAPGIPVCINSVNCGPTGGYSLSTCSSIGPGSPFCTYYVNNSSGSTITYDGLTTTLVAIARVTPCDTYHLKLGIADAADESYDSGVFLRAGSLTSVSYSVGAIGINPADTGYGAQYCVRGCTPGMFVFSNTGSLADSITIHYIIGGTATNGIDYSTIADSATIHVGHATDTVFINGLTTATGIKSVVLYILSPYSCGAGPTIVDSVELTIYDSLYVHINTPDTAICVGQHVNISATGAAGLTYSWSPASSLSSSTILSPVATPTVTTTYTLTGTLPGAGCAPGHDEITIIVAQMPALNITPPEKFMCVGQTFTIPLVVSPPGSYTYSWSPSTYLSSPSVANPVITPTAGGSISYTVTVGPAGCSATDTFRLDVSSSYAHINTPDTAICIGQHVDVNATGSAGVTYLWSPAATLSSDTILTPVATPSVTTTYALITTLPGSVCPPIIDSITITVYQPPVIDLPGVQTVCINHPMTIAFSTTPASGYTYVWSPATNLSSATVSNPTVTPTTTGDIEYTIQVSSPVAGCDATDSFQLHVVSNNFSLISQDTAICYPPGNFQVFATGDPTSTYVWVPSTGVSNPNVIAPTISPSLTTVYTVTASFPGCPDVSYTLGYAVEHPIVNIIPFDSTFCIAYPVFIKAEVTPADSLYTFAWSSAPGTPLSLLSDPNLLQPDFFSPAPGVFTYYLTVHGALGCTVSDSVILRAIPPPHIDVNPVSASVIYGSSIQLQASSTSPEHLLYWWAPDNGTLNNPNINDPISTPVDSVTVYTVYAMTPAGCRDSANVTVSIDYEDDCIPSAFTPNGDGLNDIFKLCSNMRHEQLISFRVYNRWGQLVFENTYDPGKGWDGTFNGVPQDMGVYNYIIIIGRPDGTNKILKGDVTLIR